MEIFIDQSGRLEFTKHDTVIAYSAKNGLTKSIFISAKEKRILQGKFRNIKQDKFYIYKTFAFLICEIVKDDISNISIINIDMEYEGKEFLIKGFLTTFMKKHFEEFTANQIRFVHVGKNHQCHYTAIKTFQGILKPDLKVDASYIFRKCFEK